MNGINESEPSYVVKNYLSYQTNEGHDDEQPDCGEASEKSPKRFHKWSSTDSRKRAIKARSGRSGHSNDDEIAS